MYIEISLHRLNRNSEPLAAINPARNRIVWQSVILTKGTMGGTTSKIYGKLSRSWTSASCSSENLENTAGKEKFKDFDDTGLPALRFSRGLGEVVQLVAVKFY